MIRRRNPFELDRVSKMLLGGPIMSDSDNDSEEVEDVEEEDGSRPEKILKTRRNKKGRDEYLVKWKDCGDEDNSWESYDTVKKYKELMKDFNNPWMKQGKSEMVAREEGRKKRMEEASGGQGQIQDKTVSGGFGVARSGKGRPKKSRTLTEDPGSSSTATTSISAVEKCLLNPVILANLFKVCSHELLANCRLVCKTWYRESLVTWRSTSSLIVLHRLKTKEKIYLAKTEDLNFEDCYYRTLEDEDKNFEGSSKTSLGTFSAYLRQECRTKPYRQFHLSNWTLSPPPTNGTSSRDLKSIKGQQCQFWELVGANVTFLHLNECKFQDASAFRKFIFQTCPNLKTLVLHNCSTIKSQGKAKKLTATHYQAPAYGEQSNLKSLSVSREGNEDQGLPVSYLELLSHFPSLTSLHLMYGAQLDYNHTDPDTNDLISWIDAIKGIRQHDADKLALQTFSMSPGFEVGDSTDPAKCRKLCSLFQEMDLNPELLDVELCCDVVDVLKDVLAFSGKTIRTIRALRDGKGGGCCGPRPTPTSNEFPCKFPFGVELDNLKELTLSAEFCRDLEFMKWTPNLEKLQIIKNNREWGHHGATPDKMILNTSEEVMSDVKLLKLKELWMGYRLHDVEETRRFCGWMPNLEVATMFLDDEQFGIICGSWKNLKHLHVLGSRLGDKGITGMGFKGDDDGSIRPNITHLKDLICFQFAILDSKLSDASMNNGFLKLPKLQTLEISSYRSTIGDEAMKAIHEKVPNCQLIGCPAMYGPRRYGGGPVIRHRNFECPYFR